MNFSKVFDQLKNVEELKTAYFNTKMDICQLLIDNFPKCINNNTIFYKDIKEELLFLLGTIPKNKTSRYDLFTHKTFSGNSLVWRYPFKDFYYHSREYGRLSTAILYKKVKICNKSLILLPEYSSDDEITIDLSKITNLKEDRLELFLEYMRRFDELNLKELRFSNIVIGYSGNIIVQDCAINSLVNINENYRNSGGEYNNDFVKAKKIMEEKIEETNDELHFILKNKKYFIDSLKLAEETKKIHEKKCFELLEDLKTSNSAYKILQEL